MGKNRMAWIPVIVVIIGGLFGLFEYVLPCYVFDGDGDGVHNCYDDCFNPECCKVDEHGCPKDSDGDGVHDCDDDYYNPECSIVDIHGCPKDSDGDGVHDCNDECFDPECSIVDIHGCPKDSDGDGVHDCDDDCPYEKGDIINGGCPVREERTISIIIFFVNYDAEGEDDDANLNGEWVEIRNTGDQDMNMTGWKLHDESGHVFSFPYGFVLKAGQSVKIYTGSGENTASELYWGRNKSVWNNDRDCAYLVDDQGNVVGKRCWEET